MTHNYPYTLSFTSHSAAINPSITLAELYLQLGDWQAVRETILNDNTLQTRTASSSRRMFSELSSRLQTLPEPALALLLNNDSNSQKQLIWWAICRRYAPINDFMLEVVNEQYQRSDRQLKRDSFDHFYQRKAEWHSQLNTLSPSTVQKAKRVLFNMLKECGIINNEEHIVPQILHHDMLHLIEKYDTFAINLFPHAKPLSS